MVKWLTVILCVSVASLAMANNGKVLNLYSYSEYIPDVVLKQFTQQTGIKVNYSYYSDNYELYTRLKTDPHSGYDIIVPSSYFVAKMRKEGMLHRLNKKALTHFKYLNPLLINKAYDPGNQYSVPYVWGTTGILVNKKYHNPKLINSWLDLWHKRYRNRILLINDIREVFGFALISAGFSTNDINPAHIKKAYQQMLKLMPNVRIITTDASYMNMYIDEDATLGIVYSGDAFVITQENPNLVYIYPKDGFDIWIDCLAIPKYAPHYENALKFINFIMQPKIAKEITMGIGYATPNLAGMKQLPKKYRDNPILNPDQKILKRGQIETDTSSVMNLYEHYWQLLRLS